MATTERIDPPWEPPLAGSEIEHLIGALDRQRYTFRWKADGLDADGLHATFGASRLTLAGLLKHLAWVERYYFIVLLGREAPGEPWASVDWENEPDWEFTSAVEDNPQTLYATYDESVVAARRYLSASLAGGGLDQAVPGRRGVSLRRVLFDLVEEYSRHTGHADLIRESIDGRTGEDPPDGFRVAAWAVA